MFRLLKADEIEVKIKQVSEKGAVALLYKTARTDMQILDDTVGAMNWETDYKVIKDNLYCGIGIRNVTNDKITWKWDCGTESREDGEGNEKKGEASDAFKRAGFKWGIGRELYTAPFIFLKVDTVKDNNKYKLSDRFATFSVKSIGYTDKTITSLVIVNNRGVEVFCFGSRQKQDKPKEETQQPIQKQPTIDLDGVAKYFNVSVDKLTDEMKEMALKRKRKEITPDELAAYKQELNYDS